jgi:HlyD family secretion protein
MKTILALLLALGVLGGGASFLFLKDADPADSPFRTAAVERGNLTATVSATGTVQAEEVIDVGAQVQIATRIKRFGPDPRDSSRSINFRSEVEEGTLLAELDDAFFRSQLDQAEADVAQAQANVARADADIAQYRAKLNQAEREWGRVRRLSVGKGAVSDVEYDTAQANYETAKSLLAVGQAALHQAQKALQKAEGARKQAEVNLSYCTVTSPVKGVIIDRRVNVGQTVVSSLNASSLFLIAKDLKRLEVWAAVNEADIGSIRPGQKVRFTVDSFPNESFEGEVAVIRLNAQMTQNVVTYPVVVRTDNSSGRLLPYMTANLQFEVTHRDNILTVPNAALRWKPQVQHVAPNAREEYARSLKKSAPAGTGKPGSSPKERQAKGTVWVAEGEFVRPVRIAVGLSDGTNTEVVGDGLPEGSTVVIGATVSGAADTTVNPFAPNIGKRSNQ